MGADEDGKFLTTDCTNGHGLRRFRIRANPWDPWFPKSLRLFALSEVKTNQTVAMSLVRSTWSAMSCLMMGNLSWSCGWVLTDMWLMRLVTP